MPTLGKHVIACSHSVFQRTQDPSFKPNDKFVLDQPLASGRGSSGGGSSGGGSSGGGSSGGGSSGGGSSGVRVQRRVFGCGGHENLEQSHENQWKSGAQPRQSVNIWNTSTKFGKIWSRTTKISALCHTATSSSDHFEHTRKPDVETYNEKCMFDFGQLRLRPISTSSNFD